MTFGFTLASTERQIVRVQGKGQVTLSAESRRRRGIREGDLVEVTETTDGWLIKPQQVLPRATPISDEAIQAGLAALEKAAALRSKQLAAHGGNVLPSSVELIREIRQELTDRL